MKTITAIFTQKSLGVYLLGSFLCLSPTHAQEPGGVFEYSIKMPYSQDYLLLLRQYQGKPGEKTYFELYRLNLETIKSNDTKACQSQIQELSTFTQEQLQKYIEPTEKDYKAGLNKGLCNDLNQDGKDEVLLGFGSLLYFGNRHSGFFLYENTNHQTRSLFSSESVPGFGYFHGDFMVLRSPKKPQEWPDLLGISMGGIGGEPGEKQVAYIAPLTYSAENKSYQRGKLIYSEQEVLHETQNIPLTYPGFDASMLPNDQLVLNRSGKLIGGLYREAVMYSTFYGDALMVIESQSKRVEKVFLEDANKGLIKGLKTRFPQYYPREFPDGEFAALEPKVLGFNQENLIFKLDLYGACMDLPDIGPCKYGGEHEGISFDKKYPRRFAGYWAYHYRTGAFKLISWNSQASVNVEHPGYDVMIEEVRSAP